MCVSKLNGGNAPPARLRAQHTAPPLGRIPALPVAREGLPPVYESLYW